jgi:hypothetical protein
MSHLRVHQDVCLLPGMHERAGAVPDDRQVAAAEANNHMRTRAQPCIPRHCMCSCIAARAECSGTAASTQRSCTAARTHSLWTIASVKVSREDLAAALVHLLAATPACTAHGGFSCMLVSPQASLRLVHLPRQSSATASGSAFSMPMPAAEQGHALLQLTDGCCKNILDSTRKRACCTDAQQLDGWWVAAQLAQQTRSTHDMD